MDQPSIGAEIALVDVTKSYPAGRTEHITAADRVTLAVAPASAMSLTGASGSGKSTLLHLIGAMDVADSGQIVVDGVDLSTLSRRSLAGYRRRVGFVFQRFHLLPALTVEDNILAPVLPYRVDFDRRARCRVLVDAVGLTGRERALPSQLSGGQQQRVAIARALINRPGLLLADEPTGNLDTTTGAQIIDLLFDLQATYGATLVIATHDSQVAARCGRIVRLRDGAVVDDTRLSDPEHSDLLDEIERFGLR